MESEQTGLAFSLPLSPEHVRVNSPVEFAHDYLYPSPEARDTVSFGLDDVLPTAASDSEDFGTVLAAALPPSGQEAQSSAAYSEDVDVLSRATAKLTLDWPDEPRESQSLKLDERFLSGPNSRPERRKLPFFSDLHHEISRSWKQPFSSRLTNAAAADFTNLVGSVEQGYTAIPVVKDILASHLSPSLEPSWKSRPLFPTKPCRTTSALIGKSYITGRSGRYGPLHDGHPSSLPGWCSQGDGFYLIAHFTPYFILLFVPIFIFILTYIYIYSLVLCFIVFFVFFFLHCPLSGPVLTYISLLIIPCMIVYVTNNKEPRNSGRESGCWTVRQ